MQGHEYGRPMIECCGLSVSPQNLHVAKIHKVIMVLEGGAFERYLGHEGGALMNRINTLILTINEA